MSTITSSIANIINGDLDTRNGQFGQTVQISSGLNLVQTPTTNFANIYNKYIINATSNITLTLCKIGTGQTQVNIGYNTMVMNIGGSTLEILENGGNSIVTLQSNQTAILIGTIAGVNDTWRYYLTSTTIGGGLSQTYDRIAFVDVNGSDVSGTVERIDLPFATAQAAITAANTARGGVTTEIWTVLIMPNGVSVGAVALREGINLTGLSQDSVISEVSVANAYSGVGSTIVNNLTISSVASNMILLNRDNAIIKFNNCQLNYPTTNTSDLVLFLAGKLYITDSTINLNANNGDVQTYIVYNMQAVNTGYFENRNNTINIISGGLQQTFTIYHTELNALSSNDMIYSENNNIMISSNLPAGTSPVINLIRNNDTTANAFGLIFSKGDTIKGVFNALNNPNLATVLVTRTNLNSEVQVIINNGDFDLGFNTANIISNNGFSVTIMDCSTVRNSFNITSAIVGAQPIIRLNQANGTKYDNTLYAAEIVDSAGTVPYNLVRESTLLCTTTTNVVNLPNIVASNTGYTYRIKNITGGAVDVTPTVTNNIDSAGLGLPYNLLNGSQVTLQNDGVTTWYVIST